MGNLMALNRRCVFCRREMLEVVAETDDALLIKDISPATTHHYQAIPKEHLLNVKYLNSTHIDLIESFKDMATTYVKSKVPDFVAEELRLGFHWAPFNSIQHLHMHALYPVSGLSHLGGTFIYRPGSLWFSDVDTAIKYLRGV